MELVRTVREARRATARARAQGSEIGLVPTMGALHDGHLSLIGAAAEETDFVVVSLFVNPTQFDDATDLEAYPRSEAEDRRAAEGAGADLLFAPSADEVYDGDAATTVRVAGLTDVLEGAPEARGAGHFDGVTTVVAKLFNIVGPDRAYFGQKDAQQSLVIRRMVRDLNFPMAIEVRPTVREADGLALSSRNVRLAPDQRHRATALYSALRAVEERAARSPSASEALAAGRQVLDDAGLEVDYLEARDAEDLSPAADFNGRPVLVAVAARLGATRLIDNVLIAPSTEIAT